MEVYEALWEKAVKYNTEQEDLDKKMLEAYEYMALGLPVVISDTKYAQKLNAKYKFGVCVDPNNVGQIAEAIEYLLANPELSVEMGMRGVELVRDQFNWGIEEKKLKKLYQELIEKLA